MTAQTLYDMNQVVSKLSTIISNAKYRDDRHGTIPPDIMEDLMAEVQDASDTLTMLFANDLPLMLEG